MNHDLAPYTNSKELLHDALLAAGSSVKNHKYFCPFHDDRNNPNGSIKEYDGHWKFKCFSCGRTADYFDVLAHTANRPAEEIIKETLRRTAPPKPTKKAETKPKHVWKSLDDIVAFAEKKLEGACTQRYLYHDPDSHQLDVAVLRIEKHAGGKEFWQAHPVEGGFHIGLPQGKRPLYNRARLRTTQTVVLVEGEKCVHALAEVGIIATTSLGGVNGTGHVDWTPLAGKTLILWPDNDPPDPKTGIIPGQAYIKGAIEHLQTLNPEPALRTVSPAALDLGPKEDAADYIARAQQEGQSNERIRAALKAFFDRATRQGASESVLARIQNVIDGVFIPIPWQFPQLSRQTRALLPGTITIVGGTPGSGKSWFVLQNAMHIHDSGTSVAILMLEENKPYWLHRAMAIRDENSLHFDEEWVQKNPETALNAARQHADWMDAFGRCIHVTGALFNTMDIVVKWVADQAAKGTRVIIVDPITLAVCEGDLFREELKYLSMMKSDIDTTGSSLVLVTHPKQGNNPIGMNAMAGSAAYQRACQTILWMEHLDEDTDMEIKRLNHSNFGAPFWEDATVTCNRRLYLLKTRNSSGHGLKLAYHFYGKSMNFVEQGLIKQSLHKNKAGK